MASLSQSPSSRQPSPALAQKKSPLFPLPGASRELGPLPLLTVGCPASEAHIPVLARRPSGRSSSEAQGCRLQGRFTPIYGHRRPIAELVVTSCADNLAQSGAPLGEGPHPRASTWGQRGQEEASHWCGGRIRTRCPRCGRADLGRPQVPPPSLASHICENVQLLTEALYKQGNPGASLAFKSPFNTA